MMPWISRRSCELWDVRKRAGDRQGRSEQARTTSGSPGHGRQVSGTHTLQWRAHLDPGGTFNESNRVGERGTLRDSA